jgi:hypothetical protein
MRSNSPRLPLRMIAIFLGGAQGKVSQNQIKSSVRAAHTNTKKENVWSFAHIRTSISKPLLIFTFGYPSSTTE